MCTTDSGSERPEPEGRFSQARGQKDPTRAMAETMGILFLQNGGHVTVTLEHPISSTYSFCLKRLTPPSIWLTSEVSSLVSWPTQALSCSGLHPAPSTLLFVICVTCRPLSSDCEVLKSWTLVFFISVFPGPGPNWTRPWSTPVHMVSLFLSHPHTQAHSTGVHEGAGLSAIPPSL